MSCNKCNRRRRKNVKSSVEIDNVLSHLNDGLCKIVVKRVNEKKPKEVYCTTQKELLPSKGAVNYYKGDDIKSVMKNGFIMVWTLNKDEEILTGWLKIPTEQIIGYEFIGRIPVERM
jgi:hypothetical protein